MPLVLKQQPGLFPRLATLGLALTDIAHVVGGAKNGDYFQMIAVKTALNHGINKVIISNLH